MCDSKACKGEMQEPQYSLIVRVVSSVLDKLISGHVDSPKRTLGCGNEFIKFQSSYAPDVTIESYLERIRRYSRCSDACFVMSLIYVDRLIESKSLILTTLNAHRLLITSVMLAAKFHDDLFYNNAYYSKLGGLSLNELNHLESELLHLLDFSLFVQEVAYCKYSMQLQNYVFYLEVVPSPRFSYGEAVGRANAVQHKTAQVSAQTAAIAPVRVAPQQPLLRYINTDGPRDAGVGSIHIPSPSNPHAKAGSFSEHYLCANSPLRIAPASVAQAQAYARPQQQQQLLAQQFAQQQGQAQNLLLAQRYAQTYFARDPAAPMPPPRARSPTDYTSYDACAGTSMDSAAEMGRGPGDFATSYMAGSYPSLTDSMDDSTTVCSTRTASPYPALGCRSTSSCNMVLGGAGSVPLVTQTPSVYPVYGSLSSVSTQSVPVAWCDHHFATQRSGHHGRSDLTIDTEGLMNDVHLQRDEPTPTPYSVYHQPQSAPQGHVGFLQANTYGHDSNSNCGSAMHTPSGYYPHGTASAPHSAHTPTERLYSSRHSAFSFAPAPVPALYHHHGYNHANTHMPSSECENVTTPRDCYSQRHSAPTLARNSTQEQFPAAPRVSPYPMLYGPSACANNVNINMHNANLSDPMNFYGYGAGVYAGQM